MFERFSRSWALIKSSASVLSQDKELLLFPLMSAISAVLVAACFALPLFGMGALDGLSEHGAEGITPLAYVFGFLFYLTQYFVIFFFNTALVGAAMIRLDGGDPTVRDGLRIASGKLGAIFGYALIAATVGLLLRALQERAGWIGRAIAGLIGMAWTVASFLVVPILVTRDVGPIEAVKESATLLKRTWGENVIGQGGIGVVFMLINVVVVAAGIALIVGAAATKSAIVIGIAVAALIIALVLSALVQAALSGIYSAALYRFASGEGETQGFDGALLQNAFAAKR